MQRKYNSDQSSLHRMFEQKQKSIEEKQQASSMSLSNADGSMSMRFQDTKLNFRGLLGSLDIYHNFLADGAIFLNGTSVHMHLRDSYVANSERAPEQALEQAGDQTRGQGLFGYLFNNKAQELEVAKQDASVGLYSYIDTSLSYSNVKLHFDDPVKECWANDADIAIVVRKNGLYIQANAPELTYIKQHNEDEKKLSEHEESPLNRMKL